MWSTVESCLYWEDIEGRAIHRYDPSSGVSEVVGLPGRPGSFAPTGNAGLLAVAMDTSLVELDWTTGEVEVLVQFARLSR